MKRIFFIIISLIFIWGCSGGGSSGKQEVADEVPREVIEEIEKTADDLKKASEEVEKKLDSIIEELK
ncbi:MAG: hypothetical protein RBS37_04740 [Bacteroidales bacterium]|jgi:PBP1b-binding outer membrane lipoprotein LpoB|nr:hypothetical protein [Bacteroidales bacterium]